MKTSDIQNTNQKLNRIQEGIRLSMILVGIVTAIIGSLALMYESQPIESYGSINPLIEASEIATTNFLMQVANKTMASVIWPF